MNKGFIILLGLLLLPAMVLAAPPAKDDGQSPSAAAAKELSGMSIVGNDEAPKSLYIVPWKSSELGVETSLGMMLDKNAVPVDRDVFKRQLDFYEVSTANQSRRIK